MFDEGSRCLRREQIPEIEEMGLPASRRGRVPVTAAGEVVVLTEESERQLYFIGRTPFC